MKKLMRSKSKISTCILMLCLLFSMNSCRKDKINFSPGHPNLVKQLIEEETLTQWFEKSEAAKLLTLDWRKAKQTVISGKNVVRVPTFFVDKLAGSTKLKTSKSKAGFSVNNQETSTAKPAYSANYDEEHPPELFFIEDPSNKHLSTYLLNFVPAAASPNGENEKWTGKLYEWNLTGDTVLIQELVKGRLKAQYVIKLNNQGGDQNFSNKATMTMSSDRGVNGFWGNLWDKLGEFVGWIGSAFGLAEHVWDWYDNEMEWRIMVDINWSTGGGETGGNPSSYGSYTGAGSPIYGSYVPSYTPGDNFQFPVYETYPGAGGPSYTPSEYTAIYLSSRLILSADQYQFLVDHPLISDSLKSFLDEYGQIEGNEAYVKWAVGFFMENPGLSFSDLMEDAFAEVDDSDNTVITDPANFIEIPDKIALNNGHDISIFFGITPTDKKSAKQKVHPKLVEALTAALNIASTHSNFSSIFINASTNGKHEKDSNHYKGIALDISRIDGVQMIISGNNTKVSSLQTAFESLPNVRENFGPGFKHKNKLPATVAAHQDHIHVSINL